MICKYLLPFFRSPFHFIYNFPCFTKVFWFDGVPFVYSLKVAEIKKKKKTRHWQDLYQEAYPLWLCLEAVWFQIFCSRFIHYELIFFIYDAR